MKRKNVKPLSVTSFFVIIMMISGCVSGSGSVNYGSLQYDDGVKAGFESDQVDPAYNYYYYGVQTFPKAFIGLSKEITLVSDLWKPIDLTPEKLHSWIWNQAKRKTWNPYQYGSVILNDAGKKIGVWYSLKSWKQWTTIEILEENKVRVASPSGGEDDTRRYGIGGIRL